MYGRWAFALASNAALRRRQADRPFATPCQL